MSTSLQDRIEIPDTVVSRELDGEVVILNLESSIYFGLDPVGSRMWNLVQEHGSLKAVFDLLQQEFDVEPARLEGDLLQLTDRFCERGLARVVPSTAGA